MAHLDDRTLVDEALTGNVAAYEYLVHKYKNYAYTIAVRVVGNREDAEEVAQDAFIKVYQSLNSFKSESKFSTWLYRIVFNTAVSKTRKKKLLVVDDDGLDFSPQESEVVKSQLDELNEQDQKRYIAKAITLLPEQEALVITLYYLNEQSVDEICEITGFTKSNVKVKLHRARGRMYDKLKSLLQDELRNIL